MTISKAASKPLMILLRAFRRLWVRVALMALLAVMASVLAALLEDVIPLAIKDRVKPDAVLPVLTILASSMLAVSTFSLNVMVSAHNAAASQATPRVHRILLANTTTHTALAAFIGAFVYALTSIILFKAQLHGPGASVTILGVTVAVVVLVILAMLRWIDHLSELGSMENSLRVTEDAARGSLMQSRAAPALGARVLTDETVMPEKAEPIRAPCSGYLQFLDLAKLNGILEKENATVYFHVVPGDPILVDRAVAHAAGLTAEQREQVQACLTISDTRSFEQDRTFGLLVLSEIAARALSPGVNDPGTALDVINRQERLLWDWARTPPEDAPPAYDRIFVRPVAAAELIENAYGSIARDGAGTIEVVERLLKALETLSQGPDMALAKAARDMAGHARSHAAEALPLASQRERHIASPTDKTP